MANEQISDTLKTLMNIVKNKSRGLEELEKQSSIFPINQAAIYEAEAKSLKSLHKSSQEWKAMHHYLLELRDLVYDVEDHIDRLISEALTSRMQHEGHFVASQLGTSAAQTQIDEQRSNGLVARTSDKVYKCLTHFRDFLALRKIRSNIEISELKTRIQKISEKVVNDFSEFGVYSGNPTFFLKRPIFGREADKLGLIDLLFLSDEEELEQALPVISVVGPGGIGKTTLARLVAFDERVRDHFDARIWVPVGDCEGVDFDVGRVSKLILESAIFTSFDRSDPSMILPEFVTGKKFLLVFDDVWANNVNRLLQWIETLQTGRKGSRILITTTNEKVAKQMGTAKPYLLQPLDKKASWLVCENSALGSWVQNDKFKSDFKYLDHIRRQIFKKTGGFPLFAEAWGCILSFAKTKRQIHSIMKLEIWDDSRYVMWELDRQRYLRNNTLRTLESSYVGLPAHLKRCFKYCSLFPKGCWMDKKMLTQLWIAEGFINHEDGDETKLEKIGGNYFDDLLSQSSFFKDIEKDDNGKIVRCKMYETLHDIVLYIAKEECSVMMDGTFKGTPLTSRTRHSSSHFFEKTTCNLSSLDKANKMRTFLCFGNPSYLKVPGDFFSHLKFLRALDLSLPLIEELPRSVGTLKQLRYLNLSYTRIKKLPPFLCNLYLLQTLKLSYSLLDELPKEIWKLQKLRHLEIDGTPMTHLPLGIAKLNHLRTLSEFIVGGEYSTGELGTLTHLHGKLIISSLEIIVDEADAGRANLRDKEGIDSLVLDGKKHLSSQNSDCKRRFNSLLLEHMHKEAMRSEDCSESEMERVEGVLEGINPHKNLKRLEIWNYMGLHFPKWLKDASLANLVSLKLVKCLKVDHLPRFEGELPSLKFFHICGMDQIKTIDCSDLKGFPKLEKLFLEKMPCWEAWNLETKNGEGPCFMELILCNCPRLEALPALPVSLRKLTIRNCQAICDYKPLPPLEYLVLQGDVGDLHTLQDIPRLNSLTITSSPNVNSLLREIHHLKTLRSLNIHFCPKLSSLPNELRQLTSLQQIHIVGCQLLTEQWRKRGGKYWSMIAHVPYKQIDNKKYPILEPTVDKLRAFQSKPRLLMDDIDDHCLPWDYPEVLSRAVSPLKFYSEEDLFFLLCKGILIDKGMKWFSLEEETGKKCYIISARELDIYGHYSRWTYMAASRFSEGSEILDGLSTIVGSIECRELSPETTYGAYLILNFTNYKNLPATSRIHRFDEEPGPVQIFVEVDGTIVSSGSAYLLSDKKELNLFSDDKELKLTEGLEFPRFRSDGWMEIQLGSFFIDGNAEIVQMSLKDTACHPSGRLPVRVVIEGIEVRPL